MIRIVGQATQHDGTTPTWQLSGICESAQRTGTGTYTITCSKPCYTVLISAERGNVGTERIVATWSNNVLTIKNYTGMTSTTLGDCWLTITFIANLADEQTTFLKYGSDENRLTYSVYRHDPVYEVLKFYPIGSYFTTKNAEFDPNAEWGGVWELDTNGKVTRCGTTVGETGGEITHATTVNELPGHTHTTNRALWNNNGSMFGNDSNWAAAVHLYSTGINVGRVNLTCSNPNTSSSSHNNVQKSLICKRWHRVG